MQPPPYLELWREGRLRRRVEKARKFRTDDGCLLCPRRCGVHHEDGERGSCGIRGGSVISSVAPHYGEEPCLVGFGGSGTIFFAGCNLRCVFCQNFEISRRPDDCREVSPQELASFMLSLQARKVENLNLVTPSHLIPEILCALDLASEAGLRLPIVYNSSGYDRVETLRLLEDIVSIYMPDFKYADEENAVRYSDAPGYPTVARRALREMHRQVGDLEVDERGVAVRGLLVRHLVLPNALAGTGEVVRFLAEQISPTTVVNVMDQYRPEFQARSFPELNRRLTREEYRDARDLARKAGLRFVEDLT